MCLIKCSLSVFLFSTKILIIKTTILNQLCKEIRHLIIKEFQLEIRNKNTFIGIFLYVVSTIFVCYLTFKQIISPQTWNALFWIIILFSTVSAVSKGFIQEGQGRLLYYYTIASGTAIIFSKIFYNILLMGVLSMASFLFYSIFLGNIAEDLSWYLLGVLAGSSGLATIFTLISAIAHKANNNGVLVAVLGFPIILPMMIVIIKFSNAAIMGAARSSSLDSLLIMGLLLIIVLSLSYILFPYLWKD